MLADVVRARTKLYIASKNLHKVAEYQRLLTPLAVDIEPLPEGVPEALETGDTFADNARQKAVFYSAYCDGWVLADDSGLCVDALAGRPGVFSARYAGIGATDAENNQKLLDELRQVQENEQTAEFVCAIVVVHPSEQGYSVLGTLRGQLLREPRGQRGFGYDPLFFVPDLGKTFAELTAEEKNAASHRALAVAQLLLQWEERARARLPGQ